MVKIGQMIGFGPIWPPFGPFRGAKWGTKIKIFKNIDVNPHLAPLNVPNGAKSYHLPNLHHFHSEGTFLQVINSGKVKFSKILVLVPIWLP